ncbi:hypothetical protein AB6M97_01210 [Streptococcus hillyeri]|uniref:Uncharacterized protein n=1 Tax=Streptococcus hillyeri TaxID=2282420 RepID=A0A3L9DR76_9STRE|nr:hypothetical protein [Streptococcus hillyeri]RLY03966.1 hypothetical protein EAF07_04065 [Streptococcus hillyeri]
MSKKVKKKESFGSLEKALHVEFEREYQKSQKIKAYVGYGLLAVFGLLILIWLQRNQSDKKVEDKSVEKVYQFKSADVTTENSINESEIRTDFTKQLIASEKEFDFKWGIENFLSLEVGNIYDGGGATLTKVLQDYGKPSDAYFYDSYFDERSLYLTYDYGIYTNFAYTSEKDPRDRGDINLNFYKSGDEYYLQSKDAYSLEDDAYPVAGKDDPKFEWTLEEFGKVTVGDGNTGDGGVSYDEVIAKYGLPDKSLLSLIGSKEVRQSLEMVYLNGYQGHVSFRLYKQEDGVFRLFAKDTALSQ